MLRNCFWHPFTLHDTNRTMISHFRFWLTVHWLVFHDNNTQSATCIWPSSSSNSHSRHQRASWRKLSRTLSWRTNGARLCGQNVQRPRDSWVTLSRVLFREISTNTLFQRSNLTDFERFKLRLVKRSKNRMIEPVYEKLKRTASKNGTLYGKPIKGTKPLPAKKPKAVKKKKVVKKKPAGKPAAKTAVKPAGKPAAKK